MYFILYSFFNVVCIFVIPALCGHAQGRETLDKGGDRGFK